MNEDKLLTKYEVMDYLNISRRYFEKLVTEENLPIIKITQNKRYMRLSDLHYLTELEMLYLLGLLREGIISMTCTLRA